MKYIKTFESLTDKNIVRELESQIKEYVEEITYGTSSDGIDDCPFASELALVHQEDYIDDIYQSMKDEPAYNKAILIGNIRLDEFTEVYNDLLQKAREKIVNMAAFLTKMCKKYQKEEKERNEQSQERKRR